MPVRIGLAAKGELGLALERLFCAAGYEVSVATQLSKVKALVASNELDAWVFDIRLDDVYCAISATGKFILPADNPPDCRDRARFSSWSTGLVQQLNQAFPSSSKAPSSSEAGTPWSEVKAVWILAGSAGALSAIQQFLNAFAVPPPVAFIYAMHFDPDKQHQLDQLTTENPVFSLHLADHNQQLAPGRIVMIPARSKVSIDIHGQVSSKGEPWGDHYAPNIDELLYILLAAKLPHCGVMVFSGMGRDGAAALPVMDAAGARIWAQEPSTAVCASMPRAAIETGLVSRVGEPRELAQALQRLYR